MNKALVENVVEAVLYEGYMLYPYRPSSQKNRQRFTFGRVYPQAYSEAQGGAEPCLMQTECLVETAEDAAPTLNVTVGFLQPMARAVGRLPEPLLEWPDEDAPEYEEPDFEMVGELCVGEDRYQPWQEAVEQEVPLPPLALSDLLDDAHEEPFDFPASRVVEPVRDGEEQVVGVIRRTREVLEGTVTVIAERASERAVKFTVRILNGTPVPAADLDEEDAVLMYTFASTHTILHVKDGAFVSLMDPPAEHEAAAATCENTGTWPVLVGDEEEDECDVMLSSPIILYDYPEIAPESEGSFFDSTEIDEMLTLRIMTMTDEEKNEMRHADEHARQLLRRTETMSEDRMMNLHGTLRGMRPFSEAFADGTFGETESGGGAFGAGRVAKDDDDFFGNSDALERITIEGVEYKTGSRVRIAPSGRRADVMDLALKGRTAVIESVEQDFEDRVYLALVLEDDPGQDLGMMRQPGHRFFYAPDEVELIEEDAA